MLWGSPIPEIPGRRTPWCHLQGSKRKRRIGWWLYIYIYYPTIWLHIQHTIIKEHHIWSYCILWGSTIRYLMGITMEQITFQLGNPIDQPVYMYPINIGGKTMTRGSCKGILYDFIPSLPHMPNLIPERSLKTAPGIPEVTLFLLRMRLPPCWTATRMPCGSMRIRPKTTNAPMAWLPTGTATSGSLGILQV